MTHRRVVASDLEYDFAPGDPPLTAHRHWAIATAQVIDDIAGEPLAIPFRVRVVLPGEQDEIAQNGMHVRRLERSITVKIGEAGTFALVAQPWLRFTPLAPPAAVTVLIEADGFMPLRHPFVFAYDQRTIAVVPAAVGDLVVTLNSAANLVAGQTLLFGPAIEPQYVRIRGIGAANQVTLDAGLIRPQGIGNPVFPDVFTSPAPVPLELRRSPVRIVGRVVTRDTTANLTTAVVGATVDVTDFWRTRAAVVNNPANGAMTDPVLANRQFAVSLFPGALATRAAAATTGTIALPVVAGDDRLLTRPAAGERPRIDVASRQNLIAPPSPLANRLLLVEPGDPDAAEYHTVSAIEPAGVADEPARLTLDFALRRAHAEATRVSRVNGPGVLPPTPRALRDATAPGDRCLFLDDLALLPAGGRLRITGGGAGDEFQRFTQLSVVSDGDGFFRLPLLHRMARVALTIDDGGGNVQTIEIDPTYGEAEQPVDVVYFV
jgi:hypothetical protein